MDHSGALMATGPSICQETGTAHLADRVTLGFGQYGWAWSWSGILNIAVFFVPRDLNL